MEPDATPSPSRRVPQAAEEPSGPDGSARQRGPVPARDPSLSLARAIVALGAPNDPCDPVLPFPQERRGPRSYGDGRSLPRARPAPPARRDSANSRKGECARLAHTALCPRSLVTHMTRLVLRIRLPSGVLQWARQESNTPAIRRFTRSVGARPAHRRSRLTRLVASDRRRCSGESVQHRPTGSGSHFVDRGDVPATSTS